MWWLERQGGGAIVRVTGREDVTTVFTLPVGAGGTGTSVVITAAPYTLIVFTDPSQAQAGAPLAIFVVVIGQDGSPVTGKAIRATFSGPSAQAPVDAVEDAATLGPGRYKIAIAALDAGAWKVTIGIGNEVSGTYSLEVSR